MKYGAIVARVELKANETMMALAGAELVPEFHENPVEVIPKGTRGFRSITSCPTLIETYEIYVLEKTFKSNLIDSLGSPLSRSAGNLSAVISMSLVGLIGSTDPIAPSTFCTVSDRLPRTTTAPLERE